MNLLARILSHGFAIAIVLLLAIGLIYRGELFPDWELPEFLTLGTPTESDQADTSAAVIPEEAPADTADMEATPVEAAIEAEAVPAYEEVAPADTDAPEYIPPAEEPETPDMPTETEAAMEPVTAPVPPLPDTTAEDSGLPAAEQEPQAVDSAEPMVAPAADTAEPALAEEAVDDAGMAPDLAVPEAAAPEEVEAAQPVTPPATLAEPEPELEPEPEMAGESVDSPPATVDTAFTEPASIQAPEDTAATDLPVTEAAVPLPESAAPVEPQIPAPARAEPAAENAYQLLAAAREAYWLRDYELAESKYRQLLALQPDNPDGYGELGNMYFSQGMWEQSASAYFEAGTRLVKEGQLEQARQLVDVIRGLDGSQADELNTLIRAAQKDSH